MIYYNVIKLKKRSLYEKRFLNTLVPGYRTALEYQNRDDKAPNIYKEKQVFQFWLSTLGLLYKTTLKHKMIKSRCF